MKTLFKLVAIIVIVALVASALSNQDKDKRNTPAPASASDSPVSTPTTSSLPAEVKPKPPAPPAMPAGQRAVYQSMLDRVEVAQKNRDNKGKLDALTKELKVILNENTVVFPAPGTESVVRTNAEPWTLYLHSSEDIGINLRDYLFAFTEKDANANGKPSLRVSVSVNPDHAKRLFNTLNALGKGEKANLNLLFNASMMHSIGVFLDKSFGINAYIKINANAIPEK